MKPPQRVDIVAESGDDRGMGNHDRDAILARRALFISTALAGFACTAHEPPTEPGPESVDSPKVVVEAPNPVVNDERPADGERMSWSEVMAGAPPLDVPAGLTKSERDLLTGLASFESGRYDGLGKIWTALPECSPSEAQCDAWAKAIAAIEDATDNGWGAMCGYSPEVTNTYLERHKAHERYLQRISEMLLADLDAAIEARANPADSEAWSSQRMQLGMGPRACLSCIAPTAEPITDAIPFGVGEAQLSKSTDIDSRLQLAHSMHEHNRQYKAKLIIRGHASADEANPEPLARQRAEAVAAALIDLGVDRRHIEVRSYGATLPITNDPAEAALNRRVDFEVVVP